jgi:hypothetical protein
MHAERVGDVDIRPASAANSTMRARTTSECASE